MGFSLKLTVAAVVPFKWRFYPSNISAISLREREIERLARKLHDSIKTALSL